MKYVALYFSVAVIVFLGLTYYWTHRPQGRPLEFGKYGEWKDHEVIGYAAFQSVVWPAMLVIYTVIGLGHVSMYGGRKYLRLLAPSPKSLQTEPEKDRYLVEAERDIERVLSWKDL